eukprot:TRINITY_DN8717_c0_g1_i1.p1 TRINITY_DN8717_c0_g1~~TRINITY_DN8717_c0_g1_i1.p1  ORF type:complete len:652 (-),score=120.10 TRINITY_DN8717_c0_g1_i1:49-2004(-)
MLCNGLHAGVSGFITRRIFSLVYLAAFLSFIAQLDGLFGCDGIYPPKSKGHLSFLPVGALPLVMSVVSFLGLLIASASFLAIRVFEQHAVATFCFIWVCFAICMELAPALYPQLEDKLVLEMGLVAPFLAARGAHAARRARSVGSTLAACLLFRSVFSSSAVHVMGSCGAWRTLSAAKHSYQLEAFPLPASWLVYKAPDEVGQALTLLILYVQLVLSPLVATPWQRLALPAAFAQLLVLGISSIFANRGCERLCQVVLAMSLLGENFHGSMWSAQVLTAWGYRLESQEEEEDDDDDDDEGQDDPKSESLLCVYVFTGFLILVYTGLLAYMLKVADLSHDPGASPALKAAVVAIACVASCVAVYGMICSENGVLVASSSSALLRKATLVAGIALWSAGCLQLARDLAEDGKLYPPLQGLSDSLESLHLVHRLGPQLEAEPCPKEEGGRFDMVVQAADPRAATKVNTKHTLMALSSKFAVANEERRPVWIQPYSPRLDKAIWKLAQRPLNPKKPVDTPKWALRLMVSLAYRRGASARLSVGPWKGIDAKIYGPAVDGEYGNAAVPLPGIAISRVCHRPTDDVHNVKWWHRQFSNMTVVLQEEDLTPLSRKFAQKCDALPWAELPVAEVFVALLLAAFLLRLGTPPARKKRKRK